MRQPMIPHPQHREEDMTLLADSEDILKIILIGNGILPSFVYIL
jgi:hypothetical protein